MYNILIIKLDASGDVLRTTSLLEGLDKIHPGPKHVTWVTKKKNVPILTFCPKIDDIYEDEFLHSVRKKQFDFAVNFDEDLGACDLLYNVDAKNKFGFTNSQYKYAPVNSLSEYAYQMSKDDDLKFRKNKKTYQQIIFEMCGIEWSGEKYGFKYPTASKGSYVALNTEVGVKWPTKQWTGWQDLKISMDKEYIPWQSQKKYNTLEEYFEWIDNSKIVISSDSFGMHLAAAMNKPCIAFFGPTSHVEIEPYDKIDKVYVNDLSCSPCYKKVCPYNLECMNEIKSDVILSKVVELWKK
jgi:heptosyltransferase-2